MNTNKFLLGGIVGGVVYFALGYLIYGVLLKDAMKSPVVGVDREDGHFIYWALILGNLFSGFLLSYVIGRSSSKSVSSGATTGAVVGLLVAAGFDFIMYAVTNLSTMKTVFEDIAAFTVISAITGAVVGWTYSMGKKAA